jgi:hypothetical protein
VECGIIGSGCGRKLAGSPSEPSADGVICYRQLIKEPVDLDHQDSGLGAGLVADAMRRVLHAADIAGVRAMLVQPKDERRVFASISVLSRSPVKP